jgi:hypothetical protein
MVRSIRAGRGRDVPGALILAGQATLDIGAGMILGKTLDTGHERKGITQGRVWQAQCGSV